jgi:hypothetical protein
MEWETVKWRCVKAGQPRPYADSYYEYEVIFERSVVELIARNFARFARGCRRFSDEGKWKSDMDKHFAPHLSLTPLSDVKGSLGQKVCAKWKISITEPYTD